MNETELEDILKSLNSALKIYLNRKDTLSALEISLKSMLMVLHSQVAEQLQQERKGWRGGSVKKAAEGLL